MGAGRTGRQGGPAVSFALPVRNGADTLGQVVESVLGQTSTGLELVISDNASTDGTEDICRRFARDDSRVRYHRHPTDIGLLGNFVGAAELTRGTYLRWIGDDDSVEPDFVSNVLEVFADDPRRVLVTTEIRYRDDEGAETLETGYDPATMGSPDPVERFAGLLHLLTTDAALIDPLYATIRRDVATVPRRNMMREDQVFAARLALAGPWGHVARPLAARSRHQGSAADIARLLGVPGWHRHVRVLLQCRELARWIDRSPLDVTQRRRARGEVARFYLRAKQDTARRAIGRLERVAGRPHPLSMTGAR